MSVLQKDRVYSSTTWDMFICEGNRDLSLRGRAYNKLKQSIKEHDLLTPILVDVVGTSIIVVDGQHRLQACKELGKEVKYIYSPGSYAALITLNNDRRNWQVYDYVNFYSRAKVDYVKLKMLNEEYGLSYNAIHAMIKGKEIDPLAFKNGDFTLTQKEESLFRADYKKISALLETKNGEHKRKLLKTRVINILCKMVQDRKYKQEHFIKVLNNCTVPSVNTKESAKEELLKLYNKNQRASNRIELL